MKILLSFDSVSPLLNAINFYFHGIRSLNGLYNVFPSNDLLLSKSADIYEHILSNNFVFGVE